MVSVAVFSTSSLSRADPVMKGTYECQIYITEAYRIVGIVMCVVKLNGVMLMLMLTN